MLGEDLINTCLNFTNKIYSASNFEDNGYKMKKKMK